MTGFIVFGHGSRVESANDSVRATCAQMADASGYIAQPAFLELGEPDLAGAVAQLAERGVTRIIVLPYFLTLGTHLRRDLPKLAQEAAAAHEGVSIEITPPLDGHPALVKALVDRADRALRTGE